MVSSVPRNRSTSGTETARILDGGSSRYPSSHRRLEIMTPLCLSPEANQFDPRPPFDTPMDTPKNLY